jgi:tetratricopeptide (TPR) repeat protein
MRNGFWLALVLPLAAVQAGDPAARADEAVARAIEQLGAAKHADRERAQQFLWQAGEAARPALEQAARSPDPEISQRARTLLADIEMGIRPDTPAEIRRLIRQFHEAEEDEGRQAAVSGLMSLGEAAEPALAALARSIPSLERRMVIFQPALEQVGEVAFRLADKAAAAEPDMAAISAALRWHALVIPEDITLPLLVIPQLDRRGKTKEADAIFAQSLEKLKQLLAQNPQSANAHNNIAWFCAVARRHLDEALVWSEKSNELERDNPAYLDTLAEIHFQKGNREKALELNARCIALDEALEYFREQRARFKDGQPTDPVPESGLYGH